jgi:hypothetical protein
MPVPKLYPEDVYGNPPTEFDDVVNELAEKVQEAVKGFGTDENSLIQNLGDETAAMRVKLYYCYKEKFGDDICEVMESELGNNKLGKCMQVSAERGRRCT